MPLTPSDVVWRPAALSSDVTAAQNGGRMIPNSTIGHAVKNALWPDAGEGERQAGSVKYRKAFIALANADLTALQNSRVFMDKVTPGGDGAVFYIGTQADTLDAMQTADPRPYGCGLLQADVSAGGNTMDVVFESAALAALGPIVAGDILRVSNRPVGTTSGVEEFVEVDSVSYAGAVATVTLAAELLIDHDSSDSIVSSVYEPANLVASKSAAPTVDSAAGTLNFASVALTNKGAIEQDWTLTFTSATAFSLSGDALGAAVGTGDVGVNFAPLSPNGAPYFSIPFSAFGGDFEAGDSIQFSTHPAAVPVWQRRQIPAATASISNDFISIAITGEAA